MTGREGWLQFKRKTEFKKTLKSVYFSVWGGFVEWVIVMQTKGGYVDMLLYLFISALGVIWIVNIAEMEFVCLI